MGDWSINPTREGVTEAAEVDGKAKRVPAGALLMSFKLTIGKVGFAARDLFPNEAIAWIRPRDGILPEYLALWLSHADLESGSGRAVKGNTLNRESLRAIEVFVPSLEIQRRVVDLVSSVDASISSAKAQVDAGSGLRVVLVNHLLGGAYEIPAAYDALIREGP